MVWAGKFLRRFLSPSKRQTYAPSFAFTLAWNYEPNSYVLRVYSMFHTIGPQKTSWEFPSDTLQLLIWLFFAAERLKINLTPRNMKNQKKKTPNVLKEMSLHQQTLQFSRRFPCLGNGFCLDDSSLNLLLSIRFVKSSTSKHQHRKTDCFAEKKTTNVRLLLVVFL